MKRILTRFIRSTRSIRLQKSFCLRRDSVFSVSLGGKAFPPKYAEVTESRRRNYGRMICRQNHFKSFCHEITLPKKFSVFYFEFEKLIA